MPSVLRCLALTKVNDYWEECRGLYAPFESGQKSGSADVYNHEMPGKPQPSQARFVLFAVLKVIVGGLFLAPVCFFFGNFFVVVRETVVQTDRRGGF